MSDDVLWLVQLVMALCGAFGAWILRSIAGQIGKLEGEHEKLERRLSDLPNHYARRDDTRDSMQRIEATMARIESKLDHKVDRP